MTMFLAFDSSQRALDAMTLSSALLDADGRILLTNKAWSVFGVINGRAKGDIDGGLNYLDLCDKAKGINSEGADTIAEGIRAVARGAAVKFLHVYPCNSTTQELWFIVRVSRMDYEGQTRVLVSHEEF